MRRELTITSSRRALLILATPFLAVAITLVLHGGWIYHHLYLFDTRLAFIRLVPEWTWVTTTLLLGLGMGTAIYLNPQRRDSTLLQVIRASAVVIGIGIALVGVEHLVHTTRVALDHRWVLAPDLMSVLLRYGSTVALQVVLAVGVMTLLVVSTHREFHRRNRAAAS
jgi:hypothetical protein